MRILVAMSGGVDSSVVAGLLKSQGHDVIGVTMKLWEGPNGEMPETGCCTASDSEDARKVAATLDIPYYVLDYTESFSEKVVDNFIDMYAQGLTPNPCVECNRSVKFDHFLKQAKNLNCDKVATGHYAKVIKKEDNYESLISAYLSSDVERILEVDSKITKSFISEDIWKKMELYLLTKRNKVFVERIMELMEGNQIFIAVGASHLGGKTGLLNQFEDFGFKLKPLKALD